MKKTHFIFGYEKKIDNLIQILNNRFCVIGHWTVTAASSNSLRIIAYKGDSEQFHGLLLFFETSVDLFTISDPLAICNSLYAVIKNMDAKNADRDVV